MNNDELIHYGVKGMKWGVRRYEKKTAKGRPVSSKKTKKYKWLKANVSANAEIDSKYYKFKSDVERNPKRKKKYLQKSEFLKKEKANYSKGLSKMTLKEAMANQKKRHLAKAKTRGVLHNLTLASSNGDWLENYIAARGLLKAQGYKYVMSKIKD